MNLQDYRRRLGWSQTELARRARLNPGTVNKAERGEEISGSTAAKIAEALSEALGERIFPGDIEGLNIKL
jgi:transcriptional regulator with XRE-family HTH domain